MKKFLSLVLALIMTMSLVTISAGATEYRDLTDKDEIQYEEAVAVLNRIGVITGYEDGSFRPETELTRGAAAKIIVSLMIGPDAASALPNNASPYPDVPAGHTFAGVIGYCKTAGYISGYGDGTFKPANPLTGYAFAKMLLGAIGYKSNVEGFVDTGWTMNVARIGNVAGLFDRLDFDGAAAVTRDEACQLALNTLKATMVDYGNANTVVSSNGEVLTVQGSKAQYVTSNNRDINANINRRVISATNNELTLEFGEEHFKDLRLEHDRFDPAYDVYGHPSNEWSYKKVTIGTFPLKADFTFTKQMAHLEDTPATKEKALGLRGYDTYSTDHSVSYSSWSTPGTTQYNTASPFADATQIHINGWNARVYNPDYKQGAVPTGITRAGTVFTYDADLVKAANKDEAPSLSELCDLTDNGVTVEVYVCPVDADFITDVVVTRTQLMKVDRLASDAIYMETISPDTKDHTNGGNTLTQIAGYNDNALNVEVASVKDNNYDAYNVLKDLKAGSRVAVVPYTSDDGRTWEVGEAYVPETVSGALSRVDIYNTSGKPDGNAIAITIGGTSYPIAQWNKDMIGTTSAQIKATKKDVTLYLDKLGNALWADEIGNADAWIIVGDYYQATGSNGRVNWFVHGWTYKGDEVDLDLGTIRGEAEKYAPGELVRYTISNGGNGEYTLTKPNYNGEYINKEKYNATDFAFSSGRSSEAPLINKDGESTGEGIYTVSQYATPTGGGAAQAYNIKKGNDYIPLDRYNTQKDSGNVVAPVDGKRVDYTRLNENVKLEYDAAPSPNGTFTPTTAAFDSTWTYKIAPYDGVKFVFVGFDPATGEVDTVDVVNGPVNVDYADLIQINRWWKNVGTNDLGSFVASPAEAYVNDKGLVKAVVIKNDAAEPSMADYYWITDNKGSNVGRSTSSATIGADEAPTASSYHTRQYVSGADGFKEEKTGYFDIPLDVGTIITGRLGSDGVIKSRVFHASDYLNRNPDALYIKGITAVTTLNNKESESSFVIGARDTDIVAEVGTGSTRGDKLTSAAECAILGDTVVMGDTSLSNHRGLIKVDSATQFIDLRPGRPGDVKDLGDLLAYKNNENVTLKVLLNGSTSSDGFRRAYAIAILAAGKPADDATAPTVNSVFAQLAANGQPVSVKSGTGTQSDPWIIEVAKSTQVKLTANATVDSGVIRDAKWTNKTAGGSVNSTVAEFWSAAVDVDDATTTSVKENVVELTFEARNYDVNRTHQSLSGYTTKYVNLVSVPATDDAGTYALTLMGAKLVAGTVKVYATPAGGTAADETMLPYSANSDSSAKTYQVPKNATVKIVLGDGDVIDATNAGNHTVSGVTVTLVEKGDATDYITFTMSKDLALDISANAAAPNGGDNDNRTVTIKVFGGVEATVDKGGADEVKLTAANPSATVKTGKTITIDKVPTDAVVTGALSVAGTGSAGTSETAATMIAGSKWLTAANNTVTSVTSDINLYAAKKVVIPVASAGVTATGTVSGVAGSASLTAVATGFYVPTNMSLTVSGGTDLAGYIITDSATVVHAASLSNTTFQPTAATTYVYAARQLKTDSDVVAKYTGASDVIPNNSYVYIDQGIDFTAGDATNHVVVKEDSTDMDGFGAKVADGTKIGTSKDVFKEYTLVTFGTGTASGDTLNVPSGEPGYWNAVGTKSGSTDYGVDYAKFQKVQVVQGTAANGDFATDAGGTVAAKTTGVTGTTAASAVINLTGAGTKLTITFA